MPKTCDCRKPVSYHIDFHTSLLTLVKFQGQSLASENHANCCWLLYYDCLLAPLCVCVYLAAKVNIKRFLFLFSARTDEEICNKTKACRLTRGLAMLLCITGIPWILGSVGLSGTSTAVFAYIFVLLNGAQGAFIFIFHCLTYNKVSVCLSVWVCLSICFLQWHIEV